MVASTDLFALRGSLAYAARMSSTSFSTAFGRLGRAFLLAAAVTGMSALVVWLAFDGNAADVVTMVLAILTLVAAILGTVFSLVQILMFGSLSTLARIESEGRQASAVITKVDSTSSQIGANPIMRLGLTINGTDRSHRVPVPIQHIGLMRAGTVLPVRIGPNEDRGPILIDWSAVQ